MKIISMILVMNMKIGKNTLLVTSFFIGMIISRNKSKNQLNKKDSDPTLSQYINRLKEFFDIKNIEQVEDEFLTLIDFGLNPNDAFNTVTNLGELK